MHFRIIQIIFSKYLWVYPDISQFALPILSTYKELWSRVSGSLYLYFAKEKLLRGFRCPYKHTHKEIALLKVSGSTFLSVWILPSQEAILLQNLVWVWRIITRELHSVFSRAAVWILIIFFFFQSLMPEIVIEHSL